MKASKLSFKKLNKTLNISTCLPRRQAGQTCSVGLRVGRLGRPAPFVVGSVRGIETVIEIQILCESFTLSYMHGSSTSVAGRSEAG